MCSIYWIPYRERLIVPEYKLKDMTYILGARCKDGVILIGDRKVTYQDSVEYGYEDKIFQAGSQLVWGSSGIQAFYDSFANRVMSKTGGRQISFNEFRIIVEEVYENMGEIYGDRIRYGGLSVLIAQKPMQTSELWLIQNIGAPQRISKYRAIGGGEPYGEVFLNMLWKRKQDSITMEEVAEIGYFIIKYIERFELDRSVGVGDKKPQIWFIPDGSPAQDYVPRQANTELMESFERKTNERLDKLRENLENFYTLSPI